MHLSEHTVKICSLRQPIHAEYVAEAGADLFGLIFAEARRQVSVAVAREIVDHARRSRPRGDLRSVGVFVEQSADEINQIADEVGLDLVQLHRADVLGTGSRIERPVIWVIRTEAGTTLETVAAQVATVTESGATCAGVLVDGFTAGSHGGTGTTADWALAEQIARAFPTMLAGGLHPANVGRAIGAVGPSGVDVSSGVELNGEKDRERIIAFVQAARRAFDASIGQVYGAPLRQSAEPVEPAQPLF